MFNVKITKGTKRVGEIHTVSSIRESKITPSDKWYIIWINDIETALEPNDCEIVSDININEFI